MASITLKFPEGSYWKAPHFSGRWKTPLQKMVERWSKKKVKRTGWVPFIHGFRMGYGYSNDD